MITVDSSTIELSTTQHDVLSTLTSLFDGAPVKSRTLADVLDRSPGTVRMQMGTLRSLGFVKGIPGPRGGYKPTPKTFELLDLDYSDTVADVPLYREGERVEGITVTEFDLINIHHPDRREAEVGFHGLLGDLACGDTITIGPTPASGLVVDGVVDGIDRSEELLYIRVEDIDVRDEA